MKPRLIGAIADLSLSVARTANTPTIEASTPIGAGGEREDQAERRVQPDRLERGDAEDDRRDERDLVALEEVGGHTGAVTHVVAHVVGDRGRVARVVLGDAGLDLADEVGADVGRLGEDAAADAQEQREQRATEPEADEDRGGGVLEDHDDDRRPEQTEADGEHAGDAAGAERDLERGGQRAGLGRGRGAHVAAHGEAHADEPGEAGHHAAGDERERAEQPGLRVRQARRAVGEPRAVVDERLRHLGRGDEHDDRERDQDHRDRLELAPEVRHRALLDRRGDLDHRRRALVGGEDAAHQVEADGEREERGHRREDRASIHSVLAEFEDLVAAFGREDVHLVLDLLAGQLAVSRWLRCVEAPGARTGGPYGGRHEGVNLASRAERRNRNEPGFPAVIRGTAPRSRPCPCGRAAGP